VLNAELIYGIRYTHISKVPKKEKNKDSKTLPEKRKNMKKKPFAKRLDLRQNFPSVFRSHQISQKRLTATSKVVTA
jgi:hypothetical protein